MAVSSVTAFLNGDTV